MKVINVLEKSDLKKIMAFLIAKAKGQFLVDKTLLVDLLVEIYKFAKKSNLKVIFCQPNNLTMSVLTASGLLTGAGLGFTIGGMPGALIGTGIGAVLGYWVSHIKIHADFILHENKYLIKLN
ncbi:glycine zipper domain-containing protein [Acinetobacter nematophilus]|uniref:glycine zipper domain-containing protein n=1 Tax=Acinetobacter TaxID=469 RepID=UPI0012503348|nr:glycine zipper domain-containing protein [Acinetobacter bereziniae]